MVWTSPIVGWMVFTTIYAFWFFQFCMRAFGKMVGTSTFYTSGIQMAKVFCVSIFLTVGALRNLPRFVSGLY
uniref:Uncharacterized protein n=1 Tax=Panstrongylus lignarius TaxID=156445 RepID=A0A224Y5R9_9HEMI